MDWSQRLLFSVLLILASLIDGTRADASVSGTVFCDQCKDGHVTLFDYPIYGVKVTLACLDPNGQIIFSREETSNWFGHYAMRLEGTPDMSNCYAQVSTSGQGPNRCGAGAGPAQKIRLLFRFFDTEVYTVDALLSEPAEPMSFCPRFSNPGPAPITPVNPPVIPSPPPPFSLPPPPRLPTPPPEFPLPPPFRLPPSPRLPPVPSLPPMPPMPFLRPSACSHQNWTNPEYRCYWRYVNPDMKVAVVFGLVAGRRYGTDITLWEGLMGRGDPYRTLLREGTTALLNSYNSLLFPYNAISVVTQMNWALLGSQRAVLHTALRFMRANFGSSNVTCNFTPCK
ncbi:hypothetical protein Tsubulata_010962 [Turnera subulata]|uniref:Wall-associated receptor kinase galacturonan-binding domain-containing protein n=1 Tax=Turnera subulata TaxID=218843 RepID=A0A9Q0J3C7_9ROSI|nr:hypothetical protein Tsubulata_010962 [Turnera subulata]